MADTNTPAARIAKATAGLNPEALADVRAVDLRDACVLVPAGKGDGITDSLAKGAEGAIKGRSPGVAARVVLGVTVSDLMHLLAAATNVNAQ